MSRTDAIQPQGYLGLFLSALDLSQLLPVPLEFRFQTSLWTLETDIPSLRSALIAPQSLFYFFCVPMSAGMELSRWLKVKSAAPQANHVAVIAIVLDRTTAIAVCIAIWLVSLSMVEIHGSQVADVSERPVNPVVIVIVFLAVAMAGMLIAQWRGWITQMNAALRGARSRVCRIFGSFSLSRSESSRLPC